MLSSSNYLTSLDDALDEESDSATTLELDVSTRLRIEVCSVPGGVTRAQC